MKSREVIASLCWLLFSLCVAAESLRLGVGTVRRPGTGFMAFGVSVLLGALSIILLCQSLARKDEAPSEPLFAGKLWKRVLSVLFAVLLYAQLMPAVGYILATFLLMGFVFWIVKGMKWWEIFFYSSVTTLTTYYFFSVWLKCQFPAGIFAP